MLLQCDPKYYQILYHEIFEPRSTIIDSCFDWLLALSLRGHEFQLQVIDALLVLPCPGSGSDYNRTAADGADLFAVFGVDGEMETFGAVEMA